jgi:hypothetical protein
VATDQAGSGGINDGADWLLQAQRMIHQALEV